MSSTRRRFLGLLGATAGAGFAGCTTGGFRDDGRPAATDTETVVGGHHSWPMFQYDRFNSGHGDTSGPAGEVSQAWRKQDLLRPTQGQQRGPASSPPAVVDDTVFFGSYDGHVYALATADGSRRWRYEVGDAVLSAPAVVDGTVYVGSTGHVLYAVSAADGSEEWRYATSGAVEAPTVVNGTVYVGSGNTVHAVSAGDGTEQWHIQTGHVRASPAVAAGTVYVGTGPVDPIECQGRECNEVGFTEVERPDAHSLIAVSAADGTEQWRYQTSGWVRASPTVADGSVYAVSGDETVYALSAADGSERWSTATDWAKASPAVADGTVYVGSYDGPVVYAVSAADGTEEWRYERSTERIMRMSVPVVVDDTVYVGSQWYPATTDSHRKESTIVSAVSAADGSEQWTVEVEHEQSWLGAPAVLDRTIHLGPVALA